MKRFIKKRLKKQTKKLRTQNWWHVENDLIKFDNLLSNYNFIFSFHDISCSSEVFRHFKSSCVLGIWAKSNHNFGHPLHLHLKLFTTRILWKLFQFQIGILWIHQSVTETNWIRGPIKKFVLADFRYEISPPVRNEKSSFQWNDFIAIIVSFFLSWLNNQLQLIS